MDFIDFIMHAPFYAMKGGSVIETVIGVTLITMYVLIVAVILYSIFIACDSWFLTRVTYDASIVGGEFERSYTTALIAPNAVLPLYHPACWEVKVSIASGQELVIEVTEDFFDSVDEGDKVSVICVKGRFSGILYPKDIEKIERTNQ